MTWAGAAPSSGAASCFKAPRRTLLGAPVRTIVYVDGFNLYFGCLKGTPYRWLDLWAFAEKIAPKDSEVVHARYFTARVTPQPGYPPPVRQEIYLRAVATLPGVTTHLGEYRSYVKSFPEHPPPTDGSPPRLVKIRKMDEKGSDVNLASYLLLDGFRNQYDRAIIVSNDSDLATPIAMARTELGKQTMVVFPCLDPKRSPTSRLRQAAMKWQRVREETLQRSQLLTNLSDGRGSFHKPPDW